MTDTTFRMSLDGDASALAVILGTNEIASAVAVQLARRCHHVILCHDPFPPVIRRGMVFHDALFEDCIEVDGIRGVRAETAAGISSIMAIPGQVAVTPLYLVELMAMRKFDALVDARMQKYGVAPDLRGIAEVTVGLGPNFEPGFNCDVAIETHPSKPGLIVKSGKTSPPDGLASTLGETGRERFVYSQLDGSWRTPFDVGAPVRYGVTLGHHAGAPVFASMDGVLRGIARDGTFVPKGVKLLEIDMRGEAASWTSPDARARAIAKASVAAIGRRASATWAFGATRVQQNLDRAEHVS
ncbi:MAG: xanthine dehydrogenase [Methylocystis sp.]